MVEPSTPKLIASKGTSLHPLVEYVKSRLEALADVVTLEYDGRPVEYDGFRLVDMSQWMLSSDSDLLDNFGAMSSYCNVRCVFCYELGNPLQYDLSMLSVAEARTRARYYDEASRQGLLHFVRRADLEAFTNPRLLDLLSIFRAHQPDRFISLTTNGSYLSGMIMAQLAELQPIHLIVSLNSCDADTRRALMGDRHPETAHDAVAQLRSFDIPFTGAITAWPGLPDAGLRETIHFLDEHWARTIRVSLPSYSGYFQGGERPFETASEWDRVSAIVDDEADKIETPISVVPYLYCGVPLIPLVSGAIRNSPAAEAGVRRGDIITTVQGRTVTSRMECKRLIREGLQAGQGVLELTVLRQQQELCLALDDRSEAAADLYPYKPRGYKSPYHQQQFAQSLCGLFLNDDLDPSDLLAAANLARQRGARLTVMLTSPLLEDLVARCFQSNPLLVEATRDLELIVTSPKQRFWGGNIMVGDLYMCSDYIACLREITQQLGRKPDLTLIPCTFAVDNWTDLAGVPWSEIEIQTGVPVELMPCQRILI